MRALSLVFMLGGLLTAACAPDPAGPSSAALDTPDISGLYVGPARTEPCGPTVNDGYGRACNFFPYTPAGEAQLSSFDPGQDEPRLRCAPEQMPRIALSAADRIQFTQEREVITIRYERGETVRTVHMNGQAPPRDQPHTVLGYSAGRWVGETLVVETTHLLDGIFTGEGQPHSDATRVIERYWPSPNDRNWLLDVVIDDPVNYSRPFMASRRELVWAPDETIYPWACEHL